MKYFAYKKIINFILIIILLIFIIFNLFYFSNIEIAYEILGSETTIEDVNNFNKLHGLDRSYFKRLIDIYISTFTLDFGYSYGTNERVIKMIANNFNITFLITIFSFIISTILSLFVSLKLSYKDNFVISNFISFIISMPRVILMLVMIIIFSVFLNILPTYFQYDILSYILPILLLSISISASTIISITVKFKREKDKDYVKLCRLKGLSENKIFLKHILPNSLVKILPIFISNLIFLLSGNIIVEFIYNVNGIGLLFIQSVSNFDFNVVLALVIYFFIVMTFLYYVNDIILTYINKGNEVIIDE